MIRTQIDEYTTWSGAKRYVAIAVTWSGYCTTGPERSDRSYAEHDIPDLIYQVQTQEERASRVSTD